MFTFEEYTKKVVKELEKQLAGENCQVHVQEKMKNNGIQQTGIIVQQEGENVCPIVYLEPFYLKYKYENGTVGDAVNSICSVLEESFLENIENISVSEFKNWNKIKSQIYIKLINADLNQKLLENVPYRKVMDLAEVYYLKIDIKNDGDENMNYGSILITNAHMEIWNVSEEELHECAWSNTKAEQTELVNMAEIVKGTGQVLDHDDIEMYVLTNSRRVFGAVKMLDEDILSKIADKMKDDLLLLPSSIHEIIILEAENKECEDLAKMVDDVNGTFVSQDEILSYHVYRFDRHSRKLSIAA